MAQNCGFTEQDEIEELAGLFQLILAKLHPSKPAAVGESNPQEDKPQSAQTFSDNYVSRIKDNEVRKVLQQVAKRALRHSQNQAAPQSEVLIHVWDCGGQPVFLDILPAFLTSRTMFLLFFDACQYLHEESTTPSEGESPATQRRTTYTSIVVHGCDGQEISARNQQNRWVDIIPKFPCILPVGTHGDCLSVEKKEETLSTL